MKTINEYIKVVLPEAIGPTIKVFEFLGIFIEILDNIFLLEIDREILLNSIPSNSFSF